MPTQLFELKDLLNAFARKKVLTKEQILQRVGCSNMTAWRLLSQHGYFTSYNCNARYFTIEGIPQFDGDGFWSHGEAMFSKWGSLPQTIVGLIQQSSAGLDAQQLEQLLKLKHVKPNLTRLVEHEELTREKTGARYVYFSLADAVARKQRKQRAKEVQQKQKRTLPSLNMIISLLVKIIRQPDNTPRQWARQLAKQDIHITTEEIRAILKHYQIDLKKNA